MLTITERRVSPAIGVLVIVALFNVHPLAGNQATVEPSNKQEALKIVTQALPLLQRVGLRGPGHVPGSESLWISAANLQAKAGDEDAARRTLQRAVALASATTNTLHKPAALTSLAEEQAKLGDSAGASNTFHAAIASSQSTGLPTTLLRDIAQAQLRAGDNAGALRTCALEVERINAQEGPGMPDVSRRDIAVIQAQAGDAKGALDLAQSMTHKGYQEQAFGGIAMSQCAAGDFEGALETARHLHGGQFVMCLSGIASAQAKNGDINGAMHQIETLKQFLRDESPAPQPHRQVRFEGMFLNVVAVSIAESDDFEAALKTAAQIPTQDEASRQIKYRTLGQIAVEQAKAGQATLARQTLEAIDGTEYPDLTRLLGFIETESGDFASALKGAQYLTNRDQQARAFLRLGKQQTKAGKTNEAQQTLTQASAAAAKIDTTVQDYRNLFLNKMILFCGIARQQAAAGDNDGAQATLRRALEFAEIRESDPRSPSNLLIHKMQALKRIALTQAETGDWQAAHETRRKILKWESEPTLYFIRAQQPDYSLVSPLFHSQAKAGAVQGALALADQEEDPEVKAQMLVGIAGGILCPDLP